MNLETELQELVLELEEREKKYEKLTKENEPNNGYYYGKGMAYGNSASRLREILKHWEQDKASRLEVLQRFTACK